MNPASQTVSPAGDASYTPKGTGVGKVRQRTVGDAEGDHGIAVLQTGRGPDDGGVRLRAGAVLPNEFGRAGTAVQRELRGAREELTTGTVQPVVEEQHPVGRDLDGGVLPGVHGTVRNTNVLAVPPSRHSSDW